MEGEKVTRNGEAGIGTVVLTAHHASVPSMSVEKRRELVKEKAEELHPQSIFPEQIFPCHMPSGKVISDAQSWGRRKDTKPSNSWHYDLFPASFAAVVGPPPDMMGGWNVALSTGNLGGI